MRRRTRLYAVVAGTALVAGTAFAAGPIGSAAASAGPAVGQPAGPPPVQSDGPKLPVMTGGGGAVSSVDDVATQVGIDVLRKGGNASVGVPGTPALWDEATRRWGTQNLSALLKPSQEVARRGFVVDATFNQQTADNAARFAKFPETAKVFLPGGKAPAVGSVFRNPDMARAYRELGAGGVKALYRGPLGAAIVDAAQHPTTAPGVTVYPGQITRADLARYDALVKAPTHTTYRGLDVYGMPVLSSGGITVGESLNLLESYDKQTGTNLAQLPNTQYLHRFAEATATAFADRNRWIGGVQGVPAEELLSQGFADERACQLFDPAAAHARPIPFGEPDGSYSCGTANAAQTPPRDDHGTTNLTVADRWGNVASYTLTIEQTGGSGMTVPG